MHKPTRTKLTHTSTLHTHLHTYRRPSSSTTSCASWMARPPQPNTTATPAAPSSRSVITWISRRWRKKGEGTQALPISPPSLHAHHNPPTTRPTHPPTHTSFYIHNTQQGYSSLLLAEFKYGGVPAETFGAVLDQAEPRWAFLQMKKYVRVCV